MGTWSQRVHDQPRRHDARQGLLDAARGRPAPHRSSRRSRRRRRGLGVAREKVGGELAHHLLMSSSTPRSRSRASLLPVFGNGVKGSDIAPPHEQRPAGMTRARRNAAGGTGRPKPPPFPSAHLTGAPQIRIGVARPHGHLVSGIREDNHVDRLAEDGAQPHFFFARGGRRGARPRSRNPHASMDPSCYRRGRRFRVEGLRGNTPVGRIVVMVNGRFACRVRAFGFQLRGKPLGRSGSWR